jgi:tRNA(adenine34) deaminase
MVAKIGIKLQYLSMELYSDAYFMKEALKEAQRAYDRDEVPVGAVIVWNNRIIARAHNLTETLNDPTAHAEMQAFTAATGLVGGKYLNECTLYVTLEPCVMCAGASYWTQLGKIVFGAEDEKRGYTRIRGILLHPKTVVQGGIMKKECSTLLKSFFEKKR